MSGPRINKVDQDFTSGVARTERGLAEALKAVEELSILLAQAIQSINQSAKQAQEALSTGLNGIEGFSSLKEDLLAKSLAEKNQAIQSKNQELQRNLGQLTQLQGELSPD